MTGPRAGGADIPDLASVNEFRVVGPPGTGKTSYLSQQARLAARKYGSEKVLIASLTRASAAEVAGRDLPIPRSGIGTLHAHAYRALGERLSIAESDDCLRDWNEWIGKKYPSYRVSVNEKKGRKDDIEQYEDMDEGRSLTPGDTLLGHVGVLRAQMKDRASWNMAALHFSGQWEAWKREAHVLDFTDLIEACLRDVPVALGHPDAIFLDEGQDSSALELALFWKWAKQAQVAIVAADTDQLLYSFRGSAPEALIGHPLPEDHIRVLAQSYRVPRAVHAAAMRWVRRIDYREDVDYRPRDADGAVEHLPNLLITDPRAADLVEELLARNTDADEEDGRRDVVMLLASCSYMLDPLKNELRRRGVPYHNVHRRRRADWNPLFASRGTPASERLLAFLRPLEEAFGAASRDWTAREIRQWLAAVKTGGLISKPGLERLRGMGDEQSIDWDTLVSLFNEGAMVEAVTLDLMGALRWFEGRLLSDRRAGMEFPLRVARERGVQALVQEPRVTLSTVHAAKGAEAKNVLVWPDLSPRGSAEWRSSVVLPSGGRSNDSVKRLFYVAMTRARETLRLCGSRGSNAVDWRGVLA